MKNFEKFFDIDSLCIIDLLSSKINKFKKTNVILTGASGFLGSNFCSFFYNLNKTFSKKDKIKIYAFDNFIRGKPFWFERYENSENFEIINSDIVNNKNFPNADFIIHAASIASPIFYRKHPIQTMDTNVIGLRNLLDHTLKHNCKSFIFFSTSEIYGDPDPKNIPTKENYRGFVSSTGPRACYDESKRYGETLCINFYQQYKIPIKIIRPFNNYGPGLSLNDGRVITDFFKNILLNENINLFSDGNATRTFCYVSDAIYGFLLVLLSEHNGEVFNIGNSSPEISIKNLAYKMINLTNVNCKIKTVENHDPHYLTDNPQRRCPDISKAKRLLGFETKVSLDEGLTKSFNFYKTLG